MFPRIFLIAPHIISYPWPNELGERDFSSVLNVFHWSSQRVPIGFPKCPQDVPNNTSDLPHMLWPQFNFHVLEGHREECLWYYFGGWGCFSCGDCPISKKNWWGTNQCGSFRRKKDYGKHTPELWLIEGTNMYNLCSKVYPIECGWGKKAYYIHAVAHIARPKLINIT